MTTAEKILRAKNDYDEVYEAGRTEGLEPFEQLLEGTIIEVNNDKITFVKNYAFSGCTELLSANLPSAENVRNYVFSGCSKIRNVNLPAATAIGTYAFQNCMYLTYINAGKPTSITAQTFNGCRRLVTIIIRTETLCSLDNTNAFTNCDHYLGTTHSSYNPTGAKDGYIYVPKVLVDSYKTATNWVTYADQIRAIEDYPEITGG